MLRDFDSVSICLSKGLGAPVGSLLVGSKQFIAKASRWRKLFGGGMRQSGFLAACGLFALEHNIERLADDHKRALHLANSISKMNGFNINLDSVETNMVYIDSDMGAQKLMQELANNGIDVLDVGPTAVRAVIHLHVTDEDIEQVIDVFAQLAN